MTCHCFRCVRARGIDPLGAVRLGGVAGRLRIHRPPVHGMRLAVSVESDGRRNTFLGADLFEVADQIDMKTLSRKEKP